MLYVCPANQSNCRPPDVAKALMGNMRAFFAAGHNTIKAEAIAASQPPALKQHYGGKRRTGPSQ